MSDDTVLKLSQPSTFSDPLTEVLRSGARSLLARAVEAEVAAFLDGHSEARTEEGRRRLVRHGHLPEREIMTGIGPVAVRAPRVRDRTGQGAERIRFSSALLPPYARRSKSLEVLIPVLYLKGISTGDFAEALAALLGPDAGGLSASTVARLTEIWADEHAHWLKRDLSARHYVYFWADGIHVQARLEDDAQCLLVIIGATPEGKKELVGLIDGVRESAQSWRELLLARRRRAGDHGGHGERALRAVEAQPLQQSLQAEPLHGPQPDMLDADRTRADQLQGADIHRLQVGAPGPAGRRAVEQLRGDALGVPLDLLRTGQRNQLGLAVEQLLDPAAQHRPVPPLDREVAPQVEQGALADLLAAALRAHKAMRIIG